MVLLQRTQFESLKKAFCVAFFAVLIAGKTQKAQAYTIDYDWNLYNYTSGAFSGTSDGYGHGHYYPSTFDLPAISSENNPGYAHTGGAMYESIFKGYHTGDDHFTLATQGVTVFNINIWNKNSNETPYSISQTAGWEHTYNAYLYDTDNTTLIGQITSAQSSQLAYPPSHSDPDGTWGRYFKIYDGIDKIKVINFTDQNIQIDGIPGDTLSQYNIIEPERDNQLYPVETKTIVPKHFYKLSDISVNHFQSLQFYLKDDVNKTPITCQVPVDEYGVPLESFSMSFNYDPTDGHVVCDTYHALPKGFFQINSAGSYSSPIDYQPKKTELLVYSDGNNMTCSLNNTKDFIRYYEAHGGGRNGAGGFKIGADVLNLDINGPFARNMMVPNCDDIALLTKNTLQNNTAQKKTISVTQSSSGQDLDGVYLHESQFNNTKELIYAHDGSYYSIPDIQTLYSLVKTGEAGDNDATYYQFENYTVVPDFLLKKLKNNGVCQVYNGKCQAKK